MAKSLDEIFKKLYESELHVPDEDLRRAVEKRRSDAKREAEASVKLKERTVRDENPQNPNASTANANRPLTIEEAEVVRERISKLRASISRIKGKISAAEKSIKGQLEGNEDLPTFTMDIRKKPKLRKASKIVLGWPASEITFPMYRVMLEEKAALEKADTDSMFEEEGASSPNSVMSVMKEHM
jgi:hypothetical protein